MNKTQRIEISQADFLAHLSESVLINGNFTAVTTCGAKEFDTKKPQIELQNGSEIQLFSVADFPQNIVEYRQPNTLILQQTAFVAKTKNNTLQSGVRFGRSARSRVGSNITIYSELHQNERNYNLTFLTLTFPSFVNNESYCNNYHDFIFVSCVQRFFKRLIRENRIYDFVWFAERHTESHKHDCGKCENSHLGWLHFHCFVWFRGFQPIKEINSIWHDILSHCRKCKFQRYNEGGKEFASVDAKYLRKFVKTDIYKLINYVKKYVTKDCEKQVFYARCWGWSRGVSSVVSRVKISNTEFQKTLLPFVSKCYKIQIYNDLTGENTFNLYACTFSKRLFSKENKFIYLNYFKCMKVNILDDLLDIDLLHDKQMREIKNKCLTF